MRSMVHVLATVCLCVCVCPGVRACLRVHVCVCEVVNAWSINLSALHFCWRQEINGVGVGGWVVCVRVLMHVHVCVLVHVCVREWKARVLNPCVCACLCVYLCVCEHMCMCVCVCGGLVY